MARTAIKQPLISNIPRLIWANIRKFQYLKNIEDEKLALDLEVSARTLSNYDRDPSTIKLDAIEKFCVKEDIELKDLII